MIGDVKASLRNWLINLFVGALKHVSKEEDRGEVLLWLELSRDILASDCSQKEKFAQLYALMNAKKTARIVLNSVVEAVKNYKNADLPLAVKVSIPLTLLAVPVIGGQGAGVAAFGSAIGLPVLLLFFLGTAGLTSIIDAFVNNPSIRPHILGIVAEIAHDEILRNIKAAMKEGTQGPPREPKRAEMPGDEAGIRATLFAMSPSEFEDHTMSFFRTIDPLATATPPGADGGIDGFAKHPNGKLMVVQCKHYAPGNSVGRPAIHQFRGAMEEFEAWKGYFVTTSTFTTHAANAAARSKKVVLIDMEQLVVWHKEAPTFQ
jgi:hypothetical protein